MNGTMNNDYTLGTATLEIIILLVGAFILGALLCYLLRLMGLCCRRKSAPDTTTTALSAAQRPDEVAVDSRSIATASGDSSFEVDIHSLIRSSNAEDSTAPSPEPHYPSPPVAEVSPPEPTIIQPPQPIDIPDALEMPDDDHVDDLKKLEGVGPRIEKLLNEAGIKSYAKLATMDRDTLKAILVAGGREFKMHDPKSWPYQAELAAKNNWDRLREYQEFLLEGGR